MNHLPPTLLANLPPVPMTLAANLPPMSTTLPKVEQELSVRRYPKAAMNFMSAMAIAF